MTTKPESGLRELAVAVTTVVFDEVDRAGDWLVGRDHAEKRVEAVLKAYATHLTAENEQLKELVRELLGYCPPASGIDGEHKKQYRALIEKAEAALKDRALSGSGRKQGE